MQPEKVLSVILPYVILGWLAGVGCQQTFEFWFELCHDLLLRSVSLSLSLSLSLSHERWIKVM